MSAKERPVTTPALLKIHCFIKNGIAVRTTTDDNSCIITFNFNTAGGITVEEKTKDFNAGCGFGSAVVANGFYKRIVSKGK